MSYLFSICSSSVHAFIVWNLTLDARNIAEHLPRCKITKMELQIGCIWILRFQDESNFQCFSLRPYYPLIQLSVGISGL
jgi:hypothetical protein